MGAGSAEIRTTHQFRNSDGPSAASWRRCAIVQRNRAGVILAWHHHAPSDAIRRCRKIGRQELKAKELEAKELEAKELEAKNLKPRT
jgi:hypothetical protein